MSEIKKFMYVNRRAPYGTIYALESLEVVLAQSKTGQRTFRLVEDYDTDNVSQKVLRIILSYTDYVNRKVWHK